MIYLLEALSLIAMYAVIGVVVLQINRERYQ